MKTLRSLSMTLLLALITTNLVGPPAWADPVVVDCITDGSVTGSFTITGNVITGHTSCAGTATIPASVTSIGDNAFRSATNLASVTFEANSNLASISDFAFYGASSLSSIAIPDKVSSIGQFAFYQASSLTAIAIPNLVTTIGQRAFLGASSLATVTFDANSALISIGTFAFHQASSLTSIIIPKSVTGIGTHAFNQASSLVTVTFEANSKLASISDFAFYGASSLSSIAIPDKVSSIGEFAFYDATSLTAITIPKSVTGIGKHAFNGARALTTVTFEANSALISIGDFAFIFTTALESITIPSSVTSIGQTAFYGASSLKTVSFGGDAPSVGSDNVFQNVGAEAVAKIGFSAEGFGDGPTWERLTVVRAPAPAPAPAAPYSGPLPTNYSDRTSSIGDEVVVSGLRLNLVTSLTIDGVAVVMSNQSADTFTIVIPAGLEPGLKDLVISSTAGKLTAQGAFTVESKLVITESPAVASKVNAGSFNGYVAVYAKGHKGKILSWKIAGKWFKTTITSDYQVFLRKTEAVGLDVFVHLYIDGEKQSTMIVKTS
jgi:type IV secretory pathway VirB3-like protein